MSGVETAFTQLVGCTVPIQQAGMGGTATPGLAAAVADAGALGMLGMPMAPLEAVVAALDGLAKHTSGTFGINFLMPFLDRDAVEAAASRARVVEFFYGDPDASLVAMAHAGGGELAGGVRLGSPGRHRRRMRFRDRAGFRGWGSHPRPARVACPPRPGARVP